MLPSAFTDKQSWRFSANWADDKTFEFLQEKNRWWRIFSKFQFTHKAKFFTGSFRYLCRYHFQNPQCYTEWKGIKHEFWITLEKDFSPIFFQIIGYIFTTLLLYNNHAQLRSSPEPLSCLDSLSRNFLIVFRKNWKYKVLQKKIYP